MTYAFRRDLDHRISASPVHPCPLREPLAGLEPLCYRLLQCTDSPRQLRIGHEAQAVLPADLFPGNLGELFNILRLACLLAIQPSSVIVNSLRLTCSIKTAPASPPL